MAACVIADWVNPRPASGFTGVTARRHRGAGAGSVAGTPLSGRLAYAGGGTSFSIPDPARQSPLTVSPTTSPTATRSRIAVTPPRLRPTGVTGGVSSTSAGSLGCRTVCRRPTGVDRDGRCRRPDGKRGNRSIERIASYRAQSGLSHGMAQSCARLRPHGSRLAAAGSGVSLRRKPPTRSITAQSRHDSRNAGQAWLLETVQYRWCLSVRQGPRLPILSCQTIALASHPTRACTPSRSASRDLHGYPQPPPRDSR